MHKKNKLQKIKTQLIVIIIPLIITGCKDEQYLHPEWRIKVSEQNQLELFENDLFLRSDSKLYRIDKETGKKIISNQLIKDTTSKKLHLATETNRKIDNNHIFESTTYNLTETFKGTSSCQESQYKYQLEKKSKEGTEIRLFSKRNMNLFISDFEWIDNQLYIIKTSSTGGDELALEKYTLQ